MGCGTVVDFIQNFGRGASQHEIEFEVSLTHSLNSFTELLIVMPDRTQLAVQ